MFTKNTWMRMRISPSIINGLLAITIAVAYACNRLFLDGAPLVFGLLISCLVSILIFLIFRSTDKATRIFASLLALSIVLGFLSAYRVPYSEIGVLIGMLVDCFLIITFVRESMSSGATLPAKSLNVLMAVLLAFRLVVILLGLAYGGSVNILLAGGLIAKIFLSPFSSVAFNHVLTVYFILIAISLIKSIL